MISNIYIVRSQLRHEYIGGASAGTFVVAASSVYGIEMAMNHAPFPPLPEPWEIDQVPLAQHDGHIPCVLKYFPD